MTPEEYSTPDLSGMAPCCKDPNNRRAVTIEPVIVEHAKGGTPGKQVCAVCNRSHYTLTINQENNNG